MAIDHTDINTDDARQGVTGNGVRYVLGYSIALAVLAMVLTIIVAIS